MSALNDPRVLFAAERTALAWNRTSLALMGFGFVIERFGIFLHVFQQDDFAAQRQGSFWIGLLFILAGTFIAFMSAWTYWRMVRQLSSVEIPPRYPVYLATATNLGIGAAGILLLAYLFLN